MIPLVSVVIPAYNAEKTIIPCVNSVLHQTYRNLEIIVVDDGSIDATRVILEEYKKELCINNLQIISQRNAGPSAARNLGIELAKGEYIAFLDSDDQWYSTKIEKQVNCLRVTNAGLVGCKCQVGEVKRVKNVYSKEYINISFRQLLYHNCFSTPSVICRSDVLKHIKFDNYQRFSEDYRLWLLISHSYECLMLNECLVQLNDKPIFGASGLSAQLWEMEKGELSNYQYLLRKSIIPFYSFIGASCWSLCKFLYRLVIKYMPIG